MFPPWRFKLRQAQVALDEGRLDEAARLAGPAELSEYLPVRQLLTQVSEQLARRSFERAAAGDLAAAWHDLDVARQLAGETAHWQRLAQAVAEVAVADVLQHWKAGDYLGARTRLEALSKRKLPGVGLQTLSEVAKRLESAKKLVERGKFAEAEAQLVAATALWPDLALVGEKLEACRSLGQRSRALCEQLHAAIGAADWTKVATLASEVLAIAPEDRVAREARQRAWAQVGARVAESRHLKVTQHWEPRGGGRSALGDVARERDGTGGLTPPARQSDRQGERRGERQDVRRAARFMLWVDAVGGYLVCLADEVMLGQALPGSAADVPIQADISRQHAKLVRHTEGYVLEPLGGTTLLNGRVIREPALVADSDELGLGDAVRLRFRKPHVLSSTARLEILSGHRTIPYADAVLLMAESCVLGPKWQNHVVCRDWESDVVLYRSDEAVMCRARESIEVDGQLLEGRGEIRPGSRVVGADFSLSLEGV